MRAADGVAGNDDLLGIGIDYAAFQWEAGLQHDRWTALAVFIDAATQCGLAQVADFNTGNQEGVGAYQVTQKDGQRCSTYRAYLAPALGRPNLQLRSGALVQRDGGQQAQRHACQLHQREQKTRLDQGQAERIAQNGQCRRQLAHMQGRTDACQHHHHRRIDTPHAAALSSSR